MPLLLLLAALAISAMFIQAAGSPPAACPVVSGVVDASKCAGGFKAGNATAALRAAFTSGANEVRVPNMGTPWLVASVPGADEASGYGPCPADTHKWGHCPAIYIFNVSNLTIVLEAGAQLQVVPGQMKHPNSEMIRFERCRNITIRGMPGSSLVGLRAQIMDPAQHYSHSENRGGITVYDSSEFRVHGVAVKLTGGDGLYLENVNNSLVLGSNFTHNYRQGMSVVSAINLTVEDSAFTDTNGTAPMCGVDLEPDHIFYQLVNITFRRCLFARNAACGFVINPYVITSGFSTWVPGNGLGSNSNQSISVTLDSCTFTDNLRDSTMVGLGVATVTLELSPGPLEGSVTIQVRHTHAHRHRDRDTDTHPMAECTASRLAGCPRFKLRVVLCDC